MNLHTPDETADWTLVEDGKANAWQRLALATRGAITPGNILSVLGLMFVGWGAIELCASSWVSGLSLVVLGRLADVADGIAAEHTKTKSRLGEAVDATCDKLSVGIIVIAAFVSHIVPPWLLVIILLYNLYLAIFGVIRGRRYRLHSNRYAKLAMFTSWLIIFCAIVADKLPSAPLHVISMLLAVVYGILACISLYVYQQDLHNVVQDRRALTQWPNEVTDLVSVVNRRATNYALARRLLVSLGKKLGLPISELDIADHERLLERYLHQHLSNRTLLITIAGGDGSVNTVVNTLQRLQVKYPKNRYYILPLWGGNANDLAYMLNGLCNGTSISRLLTESSVAPIPLIRVQMEAPDKQVRTIYACCYASFGASAYAARQLDAHRFSTNKVMRWIPLFLVLRELIFVLKAVIEAPLYLIEIEREEKTFYEHTIINGSRIAKVNRVPITLDQPEFFHALVTRKEPSIIISLVRIILGKPDTIYANRTHLQFSTRASLDAQIDGEVLQLPSHTQITAETVTTQLRFVSTKLHATI